MHAWFSRYIVYALAVILTLAFAALGTWSPHFFWGVMIFGPLAVLGTWDIIQWDHSVLRNYPIIAHTRFIFEGLRPELRQYFFESNLSGAPFNREQRSLVCSGRSSTSTTASTRGSTIRSRRRRYPPTRFASTSAGRSARSPTRPPFTTSPP
jgi:hypothetical protein